MRFLNFAEMKYDVTEANKRAVAEAVAKIEPDVAPRLSSDDRHADHEVASQLSKIALRHHDRLLPRGKRFKHPEQIYITIMTRGPRWALSPTRLWT